MHWRRASSTSDRPPLDCMISRLPANLIASQAPFEIAEILAHLRTDVGVGRHRRGALVFAVLPRQLMGSADKELRIGFVQDLAHAESHARACGRNGETARRPLRSLLPLIMRATSRASCSSNGVRTEPSASIRSVDLEDILPRHQRPVLAEARVERFRPIDPADLVNVAEPFGGNQRRLGALALDDRVHHDGRAVDQGHNLIERHGRLGQTLLNASRQLRRRRERLRQRQTPRPSSKTTTSVNVPPMSTATLKITLP